MQQRLNKDMKDILGKNQPQFIKIRTRVDSNSKKQLVRKKMNLNNCVNKK